MFIKVTIKDNKIKTNVSHKMENYLENYFKEKRTKKFALRTLLH